MSRMTDFERFGWDNAVYVAVRNASVAGLTREQIIRTVDDAMRSKGRRYHETDHDADVRRGYCQGGGDASP